MSSGFHLHTSDTIEELAAQYVVCREASADVFYSKNLFSVEEVIVPFWGMGKWLERCLADQGIMLANMKFISLFSYFNRLLAGQPDQGALFDHDTLVWRIYGILQEHSSDYAVFSGYAEKGNENESTDLRCFSLARKLAELFCTYMEESPELLARSLKGEEMPKGNFWQEQPLGKSQELWKEQAKLWQALCKNADGEEIESPADRIMALLAGNPSDLLTDLRPITVWGCSSMPLRQLALLKKLSQVTSVHFFCLNPCDSLWTDTLRDDWSNGKSIEEPTELEELFDRTPLRQWASHEREFFKHAVGISRLPLVPRITETKARDWQKLTTSNLLKGHISKTDGAIPQPPKGILQFLQAMLRGQQQNLPQTDLTKDDTLTIHCCHNALREVEILHDHLLHLIEKGNYTNSDIIVAAPDISVFVPYIEAVFQQPVIDATGKEICLPYSVCGRSLGQMNPLGDALIALLDVGRNRYELPYVEKLLNYTEIRSRFGIEEDDIRQLVQWCKEAGIRWGKDEKHEEKYGFPDFEAFSWRQGFDRMLLGLAIDDDDSVNDIWENVAPYSICDFPDGHGKLQHLLAFLDALQQSEEKLAVSCALEEWKERLKWLMDTFFMSNLERKTYYRGLWNAIDGLLRGLEQSGYTGIEIPLAVIREAIVGRIGVPSEEPSFLGGAITFCNLQDARGLPCKVLCMLGMDNGAFPRRASTDSLNLVAEYLLQENRSVSQQDRNFFLESLLATRDYLLIYYRGLDDTSEQRYYPSTLVSELKNYAEKLVEQSKENNGTNKQEEQKKFNLEVKQSLLPYSHRYFKEEENGAFTLRDLWSYKREFRAIDAMHRENGDAALEAFAFGDDQQEAPIAGGNVERPPVKLSEIFLKQRESFRNARLLNASELEKARQTPIVLAEKDLEDFLENGGFALLRKGLTMPRQKKMDAPLVDHEPLLLNNLEGWGVRAKLNHWLNELLPENETEPTDVVLEKCFERLKAENMIPITSSLQELKIVFLPGSWFQDAELCKTWRKQMKRGEKQRDLTVSFKDKDGIPQIEDCTLAELPHCFDDLDTIKGNSYVRVDLQYETLKPDGLPHVFCTLAGKAPKYLLRGWVRHLVYNAAGDSVSTVLVWNDGGTTKYPPMAQEDARKYLKALLALYLYGRRNAVPLLCKCSMEAVNEKPNPKKPHRWAQNFIGRYGGDIDLDYATLLWARNLPEFTDQEELLTCIELLAKNIIHIEEEQ